MEKSLDGQKKENQVIINENKLILSGGIGTPEKIYPGTAVTHETYNATTAPYNLAACFKIVTVNFGVKNRMRHSS